MKFRDFIWIPAVFIMIVTVMSIPGNAYSQAATKEKLQEAIQKIITESDLGDPTIGIYVQCCDKRILFEKNHTMALKPASCNKLQTTAAALHYLSPDFKYETPVYLLGDVVKKTLEGDLLVIGDGDPTISGRFGDNITHIFKDWAKALKKKGIKEINGDILGDDDYFDDNYYASGWSDSYRGNWYSAEISALSFNDNCVDITWKAAKKPGKKASYTMNPDTEYINFINQIKTVEKGGSKGADFKRDDKSNVVIAKGSIPVKEKMTDWCTVYNPTHYSTTVLKETLEEEGIKVRGEAYDLDDLPEKKKAIQQNPPENLLTKYVSPDLMTIAGVINTNSQNFYAEQVLKTMGREARGKGSFKDGAAAIKKFLRENDIWENGCVIMDGSGLSHLNQVTPRQLVKLLRYMRTTDYWEDFRETLPRGATRGSLKDKFEDTEEEKRIAPRIYGKTGHIGGVCSLSGVVYNETGKEIFYSVIINGYSCPLSDCRRFCNDIAFELARSKIR